MMPRVIFMQSVEKNTVVQAPGKEVQNWKNINQGASPAAWTAAGRRLLALCPKKEERRIRLRPNAKRLRA